MANGVCLYLGGTVRRSFAVTLPGGEQEVELPEGVVGFIEVFKSREDAEKYGGGCQGMMVAQEKTR